MYFVVYCDTWRLFVDCCVCVCKYVCMYVCMSLCACECVCTCMSVMLPLYDSVDVFV